MTEIGIYSTDLHQIFRISRHSLWMRTGDRSDICLVIWAIWRRIAISHFLLVVYVFTPHHLVSLCGIICDLVYQLPTRTYWSLTEIAFGVPVKFLTCSRVRHLSDKPCYVTEKNALFMKGRRNCCMRCKTRRIVKACTSYTRLRRWRTRFVVTTLTSSTPRGLQATTRHAKNTVIRQQTRVRTDLSK